MYRPKILGYLLRWVCLIGGVLLCAGPVVYGAEKQVDTTITAQKMTAQGKAQRAVFEGKVVLTQGDLTVHSDTMVVLFKKDSGDTPEKSKSEATGSYQKIDVIKAIGKVVIKKGEGKATCGHAVYYKDEEKIVLTESPVAWQQGARVSGPKMTMYLKEERSVVEGGSRVMIFDEEGNSK